MKVALWCIGKTDEGYIAEGLQIYLRRLTNYLTFELREFPLPKNNKAATPQDHKTNDRDTVNKLLRPTDFLVLLDDKGREYTSEKFAAYLQKCFNEVSGNIIFLTGGAYGFHEDIYARANARVSLSKMTFTHQMARLIFLEQLYRAMTILRNEPYHH